MQALLLSFCSKSPQSDFSRCIAGPHTQSGTQVSQVLTQVLTSKKLQPGTYQAQKTYYLASFGNHQIPVNPSLGPGLWHTYSLHGE